MCLNGVIPEGLEAKQLMHFSLKNKVCKYQKVNQKVQMTKSLNDKKSKWQKSPRQKRLNDKKIDDNKSLNEKSVNEKRLHDIKIVKIAKILNDKMSK